MALTQEVHDLTAHLTTSHMNHDCAKLTAYLRKYGTRTDVQKLRAMVAKRPIRDKTSWEHLHALRLEFGTKPETLTLLRWIFEDSLTPCGTCQMASFFSPLPGRRPAAIWSSSNLLLATFTQHLASHPTSGSLLMTSLPLPSPLTVTSHLDQKELTSLLALLLISIRDAFLTTYSLLPSHLSEDSHHKYFKLSHTHQIILKLWRFLLQKWSFSHK